MRPDETMDKLLRALYLNSDRNPAGPCPTGQALMAYVGGGAGPEEDDRVREHLTRCPLCLEAILAMQTCPDLKQAAESVDVASERQRLTRRMTSAGEVSESAPAAHEDAAALPRPRPSTGGWFSFGRALGWDGLWSSRALATAAVLLIVVAVSVLYVGRRTSYGVISADELTTEIGRHSRGRAPSLLEEGLEAWQKGDRVRARARLLALVEQGPAGYEAHYYLGLFYLAEATRGLWPGTDPSYLDQGMDHLQKAAARANNDSFRADCLIFLARASIWKGDLASARNHLRDLLALAESSDALLKRKGQAEPLLRELDSLMR